MNLAALVSRRGQSSTALTDLEDSKNPGQPENAKNLGCACRLVGRPVHRLVGGSDGVLVGRKVAGLIDGLLVGRRHVGADAMLGRGAKGPGMRFSHTASPDP